MNKINLFKRISILLTTVFSLIFICIVLGNCPVYPIYNDCWYSDNGNFTVVKDLDNNTTLDRSIDSNIVYKDIQNSIMNFDTVISTLTKGDSLILRINRTEQITTDVSADYYGYSNTGTERLIYCRVKEGVVGAGDSGSPLFYGDKIIGVLCYGVMGDSTLFIARAVEDVISIDSTKTILLKPKANRDTTTIEPVGLSKFVDLSPVLLDLPYIKHKIDTRFGDDYSTSKSAMRKVLNRSSSTTTDITVGFSIGVAEVMGDLVNYYAIGTASYIKNDKIYAFGHSYMNSGETNLIATDAKMIMMTEGDVVFKLAKITGNVIGDFNLDRDFGVRIERKYPDIIDLTSKITFGSKTSTYTHKIAKIYYSTYWLEIILASQFYYLVNSDELYDIYDITLTLYNNDEKIIEATYTGQLFDFLYYNFDYDLSYSTFNKFSNAKVEVTLVKKEDGEETYWW